MLPAAKACEALLRQPPSHASGLPGAADISPHERPIRVLHVLNIAQNAYTNALILNRNGFDCDVLAYDFYHFASAPEWYDLFDSDRKPGEFVKNDLFPDFYALGADMPIVADFVAHGPLHQALIYLILRRGGDPLAETAQDVLSYLRFKCTTFQTPAPYAIDWADADFTQKLASYALPEPIYARILRGRLADRVLTTIRQRLKRFMPSADLSLVSIPIPRGYLDAYMAHDPKLAALVEALRLNGFLEALGLEYVPAEGREPVPGSAPYRNYHNLWKRLRASYDVCVFYGNSPIFALANELQPYCALEHGTIRVLPFEDSTYGRLLGESFLQAAKVLITNADYVTAQRRLEFAPGQSIFFPHPFEDSKAKEVRREFFARGGKRHRGRILFPSRQDWTSRDPKMAKANDLAFKALRICVDAGFDIGLTCIAWGVDLEASRALVAELGLEDHVFWTPPLTKHELWNSMLSHDAVIDQFLISAISGIAFEALALGCRLITNDDGIANRGFFGEDPPIMAAASINEIAARMQEVATDPDDRAGWGQRSLQWIDTYHSARRNVALQREAFAQLLGTQHTTRTDPERHHS